MSTVSERVGDVGDVGDSEKVSEDRDSQLARQHRVVHDSSYTMAFWERVFIYRNSILYSVVHDSSYTRTLTRQFIEKKNEARG